MDIAGNCGECVHFDYDEETDANFCNMLLRSSVLLRLCLPCKSNGVFTKEVSANGVNYLVADW